MFSPHITTGPKVLLHALPEPKRDKKEAFLKKNSDKIRDLEEVLENQIGDDPYNWIDEKITINDLTPYRCPKESQIKKSNIKAYYFAYFFKWDVYKNYEFVKNEYNFRENDKRISGTFQS